MSADDMLLDAPATPVSEAAKAAHDLICRNSATARELAEIAELARHDEWLDQ